MRTPVWIVGSLLILAVVQPAVAQQAPSSPSPSPQARSVPEQLIRLPEHLIGLIGKWLPHNTRGEDAQSSSDKAQQARQGGLSAAERLQLRQDVNEAGRDIYRHEPPARR